MKRGRIFYATNTQGSTLRLQNRLTTSDDALLTQAAVNSWTLRVFKDGTLVKKLVDASTDATDNFYDTLQTGSGWSEDSRGFNFQYVLDPADIRLEGGNIYRFEFSAVTDDETVKWVWQVRVDPWVGAT